MRITEVQGLELAGSGGHGSYGAPYGFLVKVTTDGGLVGWGESDALPAMLRPIIDAPIHDSMMGGLAGILGGRDPCDIDGAWAAMAAGTANCGRDGLIRMAMAAVDLALWDIRGKAEGKPVHELLGQSRRQEIDYYGTHPLGETLEQSAAYAAELKRRELPAVKFGWAPLGESGPADEAIVATLRDALGADVRLLIDGGTAYDTHTAIERAQMLAHYDVHWFEEPLTPYDIEGYQRLRRESPIPIAAGEMASSAEELLRLIGHDCVDIVQIDLSRVGLTEALRVAEAAQRSDVACVNHTYCLDWNLAASLHFMSVLPTIDLLECQATSNELRDQLVCQRPVVEGGKIEVPQTPGLGVEPEPGALRRFVVPGVRA